MIRFNCPYLANEGSWRNTWRDSTGSHWGLASARDDQVEPGHSIELALALAMRHMWGTGVLSPRSGAFILLRLEVTVKAAITQ